MLQLHYGTSDVFVNRSNCEFEEASECLTAFAVVGVLDQTGKLRNIPYVTNLQLH